MHSERTPPTTPICDLGESCRVELVKENEDVARIFMLVRGQSICVWNGETNIPIDINHSAVWSAIDKYPGGIQDQWGCFNQIVHVWHKWNEKRNKG